MKAEEYEYKEAELNKILVLPKGDDIEIASCENNSYECFEYQTETIGSFNGKEEAEAALKAYTETEGNVLAYEIVGPQHGHGKSEFVVNEDDGGVDETLETEEYDESPEYHIVYDSNCNVVSSYSFNSKNPGGERVDGERVFKEGDKAWALTSAYIGENRRNIIVPVEIIGCVTEDHVSQKYGNTDTRINIELDALMFRPLVTFKCNWGEEPSKPVDDLPRISFIPIKTE